MPVVMRRKIISGCESRGDADKPYLTRWTLFGCKAWAVYIHVFHRSDADVMHDHPFSFLSLILWRGYVEVTPAGRSRAWPGMLLYRPASWVHRVELVGGRPAVTLVLRFAHGHEWGFYTPQGWQQWRAYFREHGCK